MRRPQQKYGLISMNYLMAPESHKCHTFLHVYNRLSFQQRLVCLVATPVRVARLCILALICVSWVIWFTITAGCKLIEDYIRNSQLKSAITMELTAAM